MTNSIMKALSIKTLHKKIKFMLKPNNIYKVLLLVAILIALFLIRKHLLSKEGFESPADGFEDEIAGKNALVFFHAEWCGHCKKFMPEWDKISKEVNDNEDADIKLIKVNSGDPSNNEKHAEIMKKYSINGYPTIKKFGKDGNDEEYEGDRTKESIMKFLDL